MARLTLTDYVRSIPDFPKPGILFYDITPLLAHAEAFRQSIKDLADKVRGLGANLVAAAEARGFLFAAPLAVELGVGLAPVRKRGKLPYKVLSYEYDLEYGSDIVEMHIDAVTSSSRVLLVDDLLATGGTMDACAHLVEKAGGHVVGCAFLIELLGLGGRAKIQRYPVSTLLQLE